MQPNSIAQLLSTLLYSRRFFPYYVYNVLAGLDINGEGCLYSYDPVGHCEKVNYTAGGSSGVLMQPFLDSWVSYNLNNFTFMPAFRKYSQFVIYHKINFVSKLFTRCVFFLFASTNLTHNVASRRYLT